MTQDDQKFGEVYAEAIKQLCSSKPERAIITISDNVEAFRKVNPDFAARSIGNVLTEYARKQGTTEIYSHYKNTKLMDCYDIVKTERGDILFPNSNLEKITSEELREMMIENVRMEQAIIEGKYVEVLGSFHDSLRA